jgi:hypothetical protein
MRKSAAASVGIVVLSSSISGIGGFVQPTNTAKPPYSSSRATAPALLRMSPPPDDMSGGNVSGNNWAADQSQSSSSSASSIDGQSPVDDVMAMESSSSSSSSSSSPPVTYGGDEDAVGRAGPRGTMGSMAVPDARRARWAREAAARSKFEAGDDLHAMRLRIASLGRELADVRSSSSSAVAARELSSDIAEMNDRDPEFVYAMSRELMDRARSDCDDALMEEYRAKMEDARSCIPQLNMHGLWVGK